MFEVEDFAMRCRLAPASFHEGSRPARGNWLISAPASFSLYLSFPSIPLCPTSLSLFYGRLQLTIILVSIPVNMLFRDIKVVNGYDTMGISRGDC